MAPKKNSQVATTSQASINATSSDDDDDNNVIENDAIFKQMVCASIQYILVHSSKSQVIKRLDWTNTVLRPLDFNGRKYFPAVHKHVVKALDDTFGYKLVLDDKHDGKK
jgi:hypothetical protein